MRRRRLLQIAASLGIGVGTGSADHAVAATPQDDESAPRSHQTSTLPLFPLGLVAFPGELVFLHVFEQRYRELVRDCLERQLEFGIVTVIEGSLAAHGTRVSLDSVLRTYENGEMDIAVRGRERLLIEAFLSSFPGEPYPGGIVRTQRDQSPGALPQRELLISLYNELQVLTGTGRALDGSAPVRLSFFIGHDVMLDLRGELELLAMSSERDRQAHLVGHLDRLVDKLRGGGSALRAEKHHVS